MKKKTVQAIGKEDVYLVIETNKETKKLDVSYISIGDDNVDSCKALKDIKDKLNIQDPTLQNQFRKLKKQAQNAEALKKKIYVYPLQEIEVLKKEAEKTKMLARSGEKIKKFSMLKDVWPFKYYRRMKNDGNSFYRALYYGYLQLLIGTGQRHIQDLISLYA